MTTADRNTLQALHAELLTAERLRFEAESRWDEATKKVQAAEDKLDQFLNAIEVSDAAPEPTRKRRSDAGTVRKAKTLLESARNAAQPQGDAFQERLRPGSMFPDEGRQS